MFVQIKQNPNNSQIYIYIFDDFEYLFKYFSKWSSEVFFPAELSLSLLSQPVSLCWDALPALLIPFKSNSCLFLPLVWFIWTDMNMLIRFGCGPKQLHRDPLEEVVLVLFPIKRFFYSENIISNPTQLVGAATSLLRTVSPKVYPR